MNGTGVKRIRRGRPFPGPIHDQGLTRLKIKEWFAMRRIPGRAAEPQRVRNPPRVHRPRYAAILAPAEHFAQERGSTLRVPEHSHGRGWLADGVPHSDGGFASYPLPGGYAHVEETHAHDGAHRSGDRRGRSPQGTPPAPSAPTPPAAQSIRRLRCRRQGAEMTSPAPSASPRAVAERRIVGEVRQLAARRPVPGVEVQRHRRGRHR